MIELILGLSLAFIMFALGINLMPRDFAVAIRQPRALIAGLTCQVVLLPLIAYFLIQLFQLQGGLAIGVMVLSCCPGGITSNVMTRWAKGDVALSISYTAIASLLTVATLPLILSTTSGKFFITTTTPDIAIAPLAIKVFSIATLPALIGLLTRKVNPDWSSKVERKFSRLSNSLFAIILLATLISQWGVFTENLFRLGPILLSLNVLMLGVGCMVGSSMKLPSTQVTTVAIESGFQNGTVGIVVGSMLSQTSGESILSQSSLPSAVYGVLMMMTITPFVAWRRSLQEIKIRQTKTADSNHINIDSARKSTTLTTR